MDMLKVYKDGFVYCLHDAHNNICRIGMTEAGESRMQSQVAYYPFELIVTKEYCKNRRHAEKYLHNFFKEKRHRADWFKIEPMEFINAMSDYRTTLECRAGIKEFRVIVLYDDKLKNTTDARKKINNLLQNKVEQVVIVFPHNKGTYPFAYTYASQRGFYFKSFEPQWENIKNPKSVIKSNFSTVYNSTAFFERNQEMVNYSDAMIIFWDGKDHDYKDIINRAVAKKLNMRMIKIDVPVKKKRALDVTKQKSA